MDISNEILLNILEFGGQRYTPTISDRDIAKRICKYDPLFSLDLWHRKIALKKEFLYKYKRPEYKALYDFITSNKLSITICNGTLQIAGSRGQSLQELYKLMDPKHFHYDLICIWTFYNKEPRTMGYIQSMKHLESEGFRELIPIISSLYIPLTLPQYLRYAIQRSKGIKQLIGMKEYHLYYMLHTHAWRLEPLPNTIGKYALTICNLTGEDRVILGAELVRIMGLGNVLYAPNGFTLIGSCIPALAKMDEFEHPYMASRIAIFS